nr:MAG TPA: hypothetical protein [Caudoviricetes sp.]
MRRKTQVLELLQKFKCCILEISKQQGFTYCEDLLLNKLGVSRDELEEIYRPW